MVSVHLTMEAQKQFDSLPVTIKERVHNLFRRLETWPEVSGAKPVGGNLAGLHRLRTGDYRLRFYPKGEKVMVDKIAHRREFNED